MRQLLEPRLVNGTFGDPCLYVDLRDERRALLFDLGDIAALPPRKLLRLSDVFVSHAHMDHFIGFDQLLRVILGRKPLLRLHGGPGFVAQVGHKLQAYAWNVVHRYAVELVIEVRESHPDGQGRQARYSSRRGFAYESDRTCPCQDDVLLDEALLRVRGRFVDHGMPCLAFAVEEKARPRVAKNRLSEMGIGTGAWLRDLKHAIVAGAPPETPIQLRWRDRHGEHEQTRQVGELASLVLDCTPGIRIGYVTDLRGTEANRLALAPLLAGVDLLFIESPFLDADRAHALRKNHLTARQAGCMARAFGARAVEPFHFSPRYLHRASEVADEVRASWGGSPGAALSDGDAKTRCPPDGPPVDRDGAWTRAMR